MWCINALCLPSEITVLLYFYDSYVERLLRIVFHQRLGIHKALVNSVGQLSLRVSMFFFCTFTLQPILSGLLASRMHRNEKEHFFLPLSYTYSVNGYLIYV